MLKGKIQKFFRDMSLRKKLTITFAGILCIPIIALGFFSFYTAKKNMENQVLITMKSNLTQIVTDLNGRFQRETDFTKFFSYNYKFRKLLQNYSGDHVTIAKEMNNQWEPTLWYFLTSDSNIKAVYTYTDSVKKKVGSFLYPINDIKNQDWYKYQQNHFETRWWSKGDKLYATRTVLGVGEDMRESLGVIFAEFYKDRVLEPILTHSYLSNGYIIEDADGNVIMSRKVKDNNVNHDAFEMLNSNNSVIKSTDCIMVSEKINTNNWKLYYYVDKKETLGQLHKILTTTLIAMIVCQLLAFYLVGILSKKLSLRILCLKDIAQEIESGNLDLDIHTDAKDEIGIVTNSMGKMSHQLNDLINHIYKIELQKRAAELKALQAMINPHFLYNCLSTIKWRALETGADEISDISGLIAKFYRTSLNNGKLITTVKNEIENIKAYINIQLLTHDDEFDIDYRIDEKCLKLNMLNFLLQPIVENAVKHGIEHKEDKEKGQIIFEVYSEEPYLWFKVYNNGPKIQADSFNELLKTQSKGYGIRNIQERISLYYGNNCGLGMYVTPEGYTCFTVKIYTNVNDKMIDDN